MTLMLYLVLARGKDQALAMGADLPTMAFALLDGVIAVTGTLWFLSWLRRRRPTYGPLLGKAARASCATYVTHPLVLTSVMVGFAWVALAPEIKFVLVAAAGVAACFTAGCALTGDAARYGLDFEGALASWRGAGTGPAAGTRRTSRAVQPDYEHHAECSVPRWGVRRRACALLGQ